MYDEKELLRKYTRLRKRAKYVFGNQMGEDVAQESIIKFLEGKNINQNDYFSLIDATRKKRSGAYYSRNGIIEPTQPNAEFFDSETFSKNGSGSIDESEGRHQENIFSFIRLVSMLKTPELMQIIILKDTYEWTLFEISKCFGVSESRISQRYTLSKKLLKKIAIKEGLLSREQRKVQQTESRVLSQEIKIIESLPIETLNHLEEIQRAQDERKSELAKRAFFKIPKTLFCFTRKNKKEYQTKMPRMAKIKLEGKSFICPRMEKKTINFWTQKSN